MDPGYFQHNPHVPQGRDGLQAVHEPHSQPPPRGCQGDSGGLDQPAGINPDRPPLQPDDVGPAARDPDDPTREYDWDHFDVVRAENGKIKEHWDEAVINTPQPERGN